MKGQKQEAPVLGQPNQDLSRWTYLVALFALLLFSMLLRNLYARGNLIYFDYQDEPLVSARAQHMLKTGNWSPEWYHYGSSTMYLYLVVDILHVFWRATTENPIDIATIDTFLENDWRWTNSHPGFYAWNRFVHSLIGVAAIAIMSGIARRLASRRAALVCAAVMGSAWPMVHASGRISPDMPSVALALLCLLLAVRLLRGEGQLPLFLGLTVLVGFAAGTKYNMGLLFLLPATVALLKPGLRGRAAAWWAIVLGPVLGFLAAVPTAPAHLELFVQHAAKQIQHYKVHGHGHLSIEAGWPQAVHQARDAISHIGWPGLVGGFLGLGLLVRCRASAVVVGFFLLLLFLLVDTVVGMHHGFMVTYPFLALGLAALYERASGWLPARARSAALVACILLIVGTLGASSWARAGASGYNVDTRTEICQELGELAASRGWKRIAVAQELRIQRVDLERIARGRTNVEVVSRPLTELAQLHEQAVFDALVTAKDWTLIPDYMRDRIEYEIPDRIARLQDKMDRIRWRGGEVLEREGPAVPLLHYVQDPGLLVLQLAAPVDPTPR